MRYISTKDGSTFFSFKEAVIKGLADDGGLFLPERYVDFSNEFQEILKLPFYEKACRILFPYIQDIPESDFFNICRRVFSFPVTVVDFSQQLSLLELYHGPTLAFKDFGARFLAEIISWYLHKSSKKNIVLVATSGDTGSAVANAFLNKENINVVLLYPRGMVSNLQEKQLTTLEANVIPIEVNGSFDDCQKLVKQAFADNELRQDINIISANSINIARLLPQCIYYFEAYAQVQKNAHKINFIVPSGNLGNLTSGIIASRMGLPVYKFLAALNNNKSFLRYLESGNYENMDTIKTVSNAMDVGNPSNLSRIIKMFEGNTAAINKIIYAFSFDDESTVNAIKEFYERYNFIIDPHTAVGYLAFLKSQNNPDEKSILVSTAHYGKFIDVVKNAVPEEKLTLPPALAEVVHKSKNSVRINPEYSLLKEILLRIISL